MGTPAIGKKSLFRRALPSRIRFSDSLFDCQEYENRIALTQTQAGVVFLADVRYETVAHAGCVFVVAG